MRVFGSFVGTAILIIAGLWISERGNSASAIQSPIGVYTQRYDNTRIGVNANESTLSPSNVNSANFGKLFTQSVDGQVYAQPLYAPGISISGRGNHNVVY